MKEIKAVLNKKVARSERWYFLEKVRRNFWSNTERLFAWKVSIVLFVVSVPFLVFGNTFVGVSLSLGVVAGALSETDDHPKGRIKSLLLKLFSFGISSLAVELLMHDKIALGIVFCISSFLFVLIGGISDRYRGVTFGAMLVMIYTMLGTSSDDPFYWQPMLLTIGASVYGLISLVLIVLKPWRLLDEQMAKGYIALSMYFESKSKLFPSNKYQQKNVRANLALLNVDTVAALDKIKDTLNNYQDAIGECDDLKPYLHKFMGLQALHERAASSHERYDLLSEEDQNIGILEGIGQAMRLFAQASKNYADSLLSNYEYVHPQSLSWVLDAISDLITKKGLDGTHPLALLVGNLKQSNRTLGNINERNIPGLSPKLAIDKRSALRRFVDQIKIENPRFKYAIRLGLAFAIGYFVSIFFNIEKGDWINLTILVVLQPNYSETRRKFFQRIIGTIAGVIIGIIGLQFFTYSGQILMMIVSAYLFFYYLKSNYSVSVIFVTTFVISIFSFLSDSGTMVMLPRILDTIIGAAIAFFTIRFIWPDWQQKRIPMLVTNTLQKNTNYFQEILHAYYTDKIDDDLTYRIARREAHRADNDLVMAWKGLQVEPRKNRAHRDQIFKLTYLNHALLSYLSAFGAQKENGGKIDPQLLQNAFKIFDTLQTINDLLSSKQVKENLEIDKVIEDIRADLDNSKQDISKQNYVILFNIAEVTSQMLKHTHNFNRIDK